MKLVTIHTSKTNRITCASQHVGTKTYLIWEKDDTGKWVEETIVSIRLGRVSFVHYQTGFPTSITVEHLNAILNHNRKP